MSSAIEAVPAKSEKATSQWSLWLRQIGAIFRIEIEKNFLGRRSLLIYLLAFLPLFPLMILALFTPPGNEWQDFNNYSLIYSGLYNALILRTVVFFGSAWIFMNLFRGELVDRAGAARHRAGRRGPAGGRLRAPLPLARPGQRPAPGGRGRGPARPCPHRPRSPIGSLPGAFRAARRSRRWRSNALVNAR